MDAMPLRRGHFRVLIVASLGQLTGGGLATLVGVVLPLVQLARHASFAPLVQGAISCTALAGILAGSLLFGAWSDRRGYLLLFRISPLLVLAAALGAYFADSAAGLVAGLFVMGLGIGGDYSLDGDYISEIMPRRWRLTMVGAAKASSSVGNIGVALLCLVLLRSWGDPNHWNRLLLVVAALAALTALLRVGFAESPGWLMARGRAEEAERAVRRLLGPDVYMDELRRRPPKGAIREAGLRDLLRGGNAKKAWFCGLPWACEGFGVYGTGIFLPVLVLALGIEHSTGEPYDRMVGSVALTAWINCAVLPGFVLGLLTVTRWRHVRTQTWGFVLCAAGLGLLLAAYLCCWPAAVAVAGFVIYELFVNAGPHLMTFIFPSQIYSVEERGAGAGLAAACGKVGAIVGVFVIPLLLDWGGVALAIAVILLLQLLGAAVTALVGRRVLPRNGWRTAYRNGSENS